MVYRRIKLFPFLIFIFVSCLNEDIQRIGFCDGSLLLTYTPVSPPNCQAFGSITIMARGNYPPFAYYRNGVLQSSAVFTDVPPGTHTITLTDANQCSVSDEVVIQPPPESRLLIVASAIVDDSSCLADNGSVKLGASGGVGAMLFSFNGSAFSTKSTYTNLAFGIYDAWVEDDAGCTVSQSVEIKRGNTGASWLNDVKPILASKCVSCHPGGGTSDDWGKYSSVFQKRSAIKVRVTAGTMPPGGNPQLTENEKALINCWVDDGAIEN